MEETNTWDTAQMLNVFGGLEDHLAIEAVLRRNAAGRVWVDNPRQPAAGVLWVAHRVYFAGEDVQALNAVLRKVAAAAQARGDWGIAVYGPEESDWAVQLAGLTWREMPREYWLAAPLTEMQQLAALNERAEQVEKATGLQIRGVDAQLLLTNLGRLDQLQEEMCSERASVEEFLAHSFGVCLVDKQQQALAGWCLSEYNCGLRCEVGIEVMEEHQHRGLGTLLTQVLCAEAISRGMTQVGWHCLAENTASRATAQRAGLRLHKQYQAAIVLVGNTQPVG
jgi:RimJ/RimL family protein N-acetyltransferase